VAGEQLPVLRNKVKDKAAEGKTNDK